MIKLLISLLFISAFSFAETNLFSFESEAQKNLFDELTYEQFEYNNEVVQDASY